MAGFQEHVALVELCKLILAQGWMAVVFQVTVISPCWHLSDCFLTADVMTGPSLLSVVLSGRLDS